MKKTEKVVCSVLYKRKLKILQKMLEFRTKAANTTSKLLNYWGKVATANPEPAPKVKVEVSNPIPAQIIPEEPSSEGK